MENKMITIDLNKVLTYLLGFLLWVTYMKAVLGYHFPWEKCPCCGKKYSEHK